MRNNISKSRIMFIAAVCLLGMSDSILFPINSVYRASATEKTMLASEIIKPSFEQVEQQLGKKTVEFEENRGQFDKKVRYMTRAAGSTIFLTADEVVYVLPMAVKDEGERKKDVIRTEEQIQSLKSEIQNRESPRLAYALRMKLVGAKAGSTFVGEETVEHRTNYFKGSDKADWQTDVPNYGRVRYENVYNGIGMVWHGRQDGETQYDFVIAPNADANQIGLEFDGADNLEIDEEGNLLIQTPAGTIKQNKPFSYQEIDGLKQEIESGFIIEQSKIENQKSKIKFSLGNYDRNKPLTIDPTVNLSNLAYSTYLGGTDTDAGTAIEVNDVGNVYVTGYTFSPVFPTTSGTFDTTHNGTYDVFVTKLNASGSGLVYSTFLGGSSDDLGYSIAVDSSGNAFVTGFTFDQTIDYPTTAGAYDTTHNGNWDVFVTKLNPTGSSLLYSTFLGGSGQDEGFGIALDNFGKAYITGFTVDDATDFPTTAGAFDTTHNGSFDVFVTGLNATGSSLIYSTFLGGSSIDAGFSIAADLIGNTYITGYTTDDITDFPTTAGAFDTTHNGNVDVFVTRLTAAGTGLLYSTFLGGSSVDVGFNIVLDTSNTISSANPILTGYTTDDTTDYPTTAGAFDTTHNGFVDVFVTKLNSTGSSLLYSTFIGGSNDDFGEGIAVNSSRSAFVTGYTNSPNYPTTGGGFDMTHNGDRDVIVTKLNPAGSSLVYSTFLGGSAEDQGFSIVTDSSGNAFVTGRTSGGNPAYPATAGVFDSTHNGGFDAYVTRLGIGALFDFDGDGKTDISIFRPSLAQWWHLRSSDNASRAFQFGTSTDKLVPSDYTGDGKTDIATFNSSTGFWNILRSEDSTFYGFPYGTSGDIAIPADYDGDGGADAAVFRPNVATWFVNKSSGGTLIQQFGASTDAPVPADYDGDGKADLAIYRANGGNQEWWYQRSSNNTVSALVFGITGDKAVQGDYTGDGKTDIAVWRPANGFWYILRSEDLTFFAFPFGANGDVPTPGDYDGDGKTDAAVFRPTGATWFLNRSTAGVGIVGFGLSTDRPLPNAFVP